MDTRTDTTKELVEKITDFVNSFSLDQHLFNEMMSNEHRTLQQSFTRLCLKWIEYVADGDYRTDGRNVASHTTARELIETWKAVHGSLPSQMLPLI